MRWPWATSTAAETAFAEALTLGRRLGHVDRVCYCLEGLGLTAAARGDHRRAVCLLGFADRYRAAEQVALPDLYRASYEAALVDSRAQFGTDAFDNAWRARAEPRH